MVCDSAWMLTMSPAVAAAAAMPARRYHLVIGSCGSRGLTEPGTHPRSIAGAMITFSPLAWASCPNRVMYLIGCCCSLIGVWLHFSGSYMTHW